MHTIVRKAAVFAVVFLLACSVISCKSGTAEPEKNEASAAERFVFYIKKNANDGNESYIADAVEKSIFKVADMASGTLGVDLDSDGKHLFYIDNFSPISMNLCFRELFSDKEPELLAELDTYGNVRFSADGECAVLTYKNATWFASKDGLLQIGGNTPNTVLSLSNNGEYAVVTHPFTAECLLWSRNGEESLDCTVDQVLYLSDEGKVIYVAGGILYERDRGQAPIILAENVIAQIARIEDVNATARYGLFYTDGTGYYTTQNGEEWCLFYYNGTDSAAVDTQASTKIIWASQGVKSIYCYSTGEVVCNGGVITLDGYETKHIATNGDAVFFVTDDDKLYTGTVKDGSVLDCKLIAESVRYPSLMVMTCDSALFYIGDCSADKYEGSLYVYTADGVSTKLDDNVFQLFAVS